MARGFRRFLLIFLSVAVLILAGLALTRKDREIRTEILIDAPPEAVWKVLTTIADYASWNPFIVRIEGSLAPGQTLAITVRPPGGSEMSFTPVVLTATPDRELVWRGDLPVPGLFQGEHRFRLEPAAGDRTRFLHSEQFTGLLVGPLMSGMLDRTELGFAEMNLALKIQTETRR